MFRIYDAIARCGRATHAVFPGCPGSEARVPLTEPIVFIDLETRGRCDLRQRGGRLYAADETSELLCGVAIVVSPPAPTRARPYARVYAWAPWPGPVDDGPDAGNVPPWAGTWPNPLGESTEPAPILSTFGALLKSDSPPQPVLDALARGAKIVAHNAHGFDRHVWTGLGLPSGGGWLDALDRCRRRGLPGALDAIGTQLYGRGKEPGGKRLMMRHSLPQKPRAGSGEREGKFIDPSPAALQALLRYCARDCMLLAAMWLDEDLGADHVDDLVLGAHERIDDRGVPVDIDLAGRIATVEARYAREAEARAAAYGVGGTLLRGAPALRIWCRERGVEMPDVTSASVEAVLASDSTPMAVRDVLQARLAVARVAGGKLASLIQRTGPGDSRYRGAAAYWGAHTGRWAGRGVQMQNFPRPIEGLDVDWLVANLDEIPAEAARRKVTVAAIVAAILRAVVCAPEGKLLAVLDWSAIEARMLLWLADDEAGLDVYRAFDAGTGPDPYRAQAADLYSIETDAVTKTQRQAGKIAVLACGYQGGVGAVARMAAKSKIDLEAAGVDPSRVVESWRDSHPAVAGRRTGKTLDRDDGTQVILRRGGLWKAYDKAARRIASGEALVAYAGKCEFRVGRGMHLIVELPSGRELVYRDARVEDTVSRYSGKSRPTVTYTSPHGMRTALYGGLIAENITQAACRDLLGEAMVRVERTGAGVPGSPEVVLHVHDEIVAECDEGEAEADLNWMRAIAAEAPVWAPGLPLATSGNVGKRWAK